MNEPNSMVMQTVTVEDLANKMKLTNLTPEIDLAARTIETYDVNRPALQLTGFFEHFDVLRVQIVGKVEQEYLETLAKNTILERFDRLARFNVPCIVFSRGYKVSEIIIDRCRKYGIPVLTSKRTTSELSSEMIRWLKEALAPCISIHGVLVDVYGEGVLIQGESGLGKSEAALELVKRGHRLVSDDVVEIKKLSEDLLMGSSPDMTRDFIELRGIGIINVRSIFGFEAIKESQSIDMVINIEEWEKGKKYDRIGQKDNYTEILGNKVISHIIPIRPGRNLAVIVECAAVNNRAKKMGYNAPDELFKRLSQRGRL